MKQKETATQNLTYISIMSAINAILALMALYFPAVSIFLILVMPLITTFTVNYCKSKYLYIYYLSSIFLSALATYSSLDMTIFTLLPSLITGTLFGILINKKIHGIYICFLSILSHFIFSLITIPIIKAIYEVDLFVMFTSLLKIETKDISLLVFLPFLYVLSLCQTTFSFMIVTSEISKFKKLRSFEVKNTFPISLCAISFMVLSVVFIFILPNLVYLCFAFSITFSMIIIMKLISLKNKSIYITMLVSALFTIFAFAAFAKSMTTLYSPLLIGIFTLICLGIDLLSNISKNHLLFDKNTAKIKERGER